MLQYVAPSGTPQLFVAEVVDPYTFVVILWQPPPAEEKNGIIRNYAINLIELETGTVEQYKFSELNITIPVRHSIILSLYTDTH